AFPANVGLALDRDARSRIGLGTSGALGREDQRRLDRLGRKGMITPRHAARHLDVDQPVAQTVAVHQLADDEAQCRPRNWPGDAQLVQGAIKPVDVRSLVDQPAVADADNLVDAVGQLVASVLDVDRRLAMIDVASIDVSVTRHEPLSSYAPAGSLALR